MAQGPTLRWPAIDWPSVLSTLPSRDKSFCAGDLADMERTTGSFPGFLLTLLLMCQFRGQKGTSRVKVEPPLACHFSAPIVA